MTTKPKHAPLSGQDNMIANAIAGFFVLLGISAIGGLILSVIGTEGITEASSTGAAILIFLDTFGIILPLLLIGAGIFFIRLAIKLNQRDIVSAAWARQIMFWLMVAAFSGIVILLGYRLYIAITLRTLDNVNVVFSFWRVMLFLVGVMAGAVWKWLANNRDTVYVGEESLSDRSSLLAWNLLVPTVIILILVAARPLERTFIASLTDRTFAGTAEPRFVGFSNYARLLGFRFDTLECVKDEATGDCAVRTVTSDVEELETIPIDLTTAEGFAISGLDVGPDFFTTESMNALLQNNETFRTAMEAAALENLSAENENLESVTAVEFVEPGLLEVTLDDTDETATTPITTRLSDIEALDLAAAGLTYEDVRLDSLNTYRLRSRALREALDTFLAANYDIEGDDTLDDVSVNSFIDMETLELTVTRVETSEEVQFPRPGDAFENYENYTAVGTFNMGDSRLVLGARDGRFFTAVGNTLFFTIVSVVLELILGLIIALAVNSNFAGRGVMRAAMLVPWAIPTVVSARLWEVMLRDNYSGVINSFLANLGLIDSPIAWLANPDYQIWSMIFVDVWKTTPFMALLILAGLQTIPSDIYEAADVDGASTIRQFFSMTLPLLRPTLAVALVFRTLDAVRAFDVFDVLVGRQLQSMATYNQFVLVEQQDFGYASAVGVTIFVIILVFTIIYVRALGLETD